MSTEEDVRHHDKKARIKEAKDKLYASKTIEKGLIAVHTGKGKGKSTAALGMVMRCIGHGMKVGIVQFVKGARQTGERPVLDRFPELVTIKVMGDGFTWETQDRQRDIASANAAWQEALAMMADPEIRFLLLDEINIVLRDDTLPLDDVLEALSTKRPDLHVVLTGRNAPERLIEMADLCTEMTLVKHPFRAGVRGQAGIEF
ncbi:cob(I)yrinic acid a,c-diamide adenosyltransferase [Marinivivus vitaminiproducens]|uniref:cob(I)yrinic acid a,c-diamide adenosyltransferase n=1 Tax=Marinivivus vitaminiproducens TaxID=3035935 RepID=UPI0027A3F9FA|nr:cob(I)yrinic acid a,c-diamide adenosyltransferase [Geminicoccaceae bacterium SCSIO 64248]